MRDLFLSVLNMSLTASYIIVVVLLARLALKKAPKIFSYALWAVVLFRLLCPFAIHSPWSLTPSVQVEPASEGLPAVVFNADRAEVIIRVDDSPAGRSESMPSNVPAGPSDYPGAPVQAVSLVPGFLTAAGIVWLAGAALLLVYSALSLLRLRRKLAASMPLEGEKGVRLADHIPSPFVLGVFRPKIYLPSDLPEGERDYILLHERTHIRRCDHIFRALAWLALSIHWFNPLVWLAFHLAGKDMEMSCDEAVLRKMGRDVRADYSSSLLRLSTGKRLPAGPLAFGDGDPKSRIKNVLRWKKPALWVVVAALIAVVCAGAALATNPSGVLDSPEPPPFEYHEPGTAELWFDITDRAFSQKSMEIQLPEFPGVTFRCTGSDVTAVTENGEMRLIGGTPMPIKDVYLCDLNGDGCRELCATITTVTSKGVDDSICVYDYKHQSLHELGPQRPLQYSLRLEGDRLWAKEWDYKERVERRSGPLVMTESGLDIQQPAPSEAATASSPIAELTFALEQVEGGRPYVRMGGSVLGHTLGEHTIWWPPYGDVEEPYAGYWGLMMEYAFESGSGRVFAQWADESRASVAVSTEASVIGISSPVDWWEFTVELSGEQGTVTSMEAKYRDGTPSTRIKPEAISDEEAVQVARIAAKLLTAAEDYYANAQHGGLSLTYTLDEGDGSGDVRITGLGGGYASWSADTSPSGGSLYFTGVPASCCPRLAGRGIESSAIWTDETHTAVSVVMSVNDDRVVSGTVSGFYIHFVVDLTDMTVIRSEFESEIEGETLELDGQEMADLARVLAQALEGAENYYNNSAT